jgi:copper(I)-binding protein
MKVHPALIALLLTVLAAQCGMAPSGQGDNPQITVSNSFARPAAAGGNGAVYLSLTNEGGSPDMLLSVESQVAEAVELHESKVDENDVMRMSLLTNLEVPPRGSVSLEPGGKHIMLINLKQELKPGEKISLTLNFEKIGPLSIEAEIREGGTGIEHPVDHDEQDH